MTPRTCTRCRSDRTQATVCDSAAVPDADVDGNAPAILTLNDKAMTSLHSLSNRSAKPVRVLFNDGVLSDTDGASGSWFNTSAGDIVLE